MLVVMSGVCQGYQVPSLESLDCGDVFSYFEPWVVAMATGSARKTIALPAAPSELGLKDMVFLLVYGFVEQGLEHHATCFTSWTLCMLFCSFMVISYFLWRAHRTGMARAAELAELRELCDALWAEQKDDKAKILKLAQENTLLSQENAFLQLRCGTTSRTNQRCGCRKKFALRSVAGVVIIGRAAL